MSSLPEIYRNERAQAASAERSNARPSTELSEEGKIRRWFDSVVRDITEGKHDDHLREDTRGLGRSSPRTTFQLEYYPRTEASSFGCCDVHWQKVVDHLDGWLGPKFSATIRRRGALADGCQVFLEKRESVANFALILVPGARETVGYNLMIKVDAGACVVQ